MKLIDYFRQFCYNYFIIKQLEVLIMAVYCDECAWYDPNYKGGYCDKNKEPVRASGSCGSWRAK